MTISPEITQAEDRINFKREQIQHLLKLRKSALIEYNHIRACVSMWQTFALVDQRGTVWAIYDDPHEAAKGCDDHNTTSLEENGEDQCSHYTLIAWKWPVPLDPGKERSIYVHPDIWVKCPEDWRPRITANEDSFMLANNIDPCNDRFEVFRYPVTP